VTDAEINRKIAELLEPLSSLMPITAETAVGDIPYQSPKGYWLVSRFDMMEVPNWHPRDFLHDWNLTGMLLEKGGLGLVWYGSKWVVCKTMEHYSTFRPVLIVEDGQPQRAVALAFLKMHKGEQ
jgi:hypothetical protein